MTWGEWDEMPDGYETEHCPACGELPSYCQGHGEIGDPAGFRVVMNHYHNEIHDDCHETADCQQEADDEPDRDDPDPEFHNSNHWDINREHR